MKRTRITDYFSQNRTSHKTTPIEMCDDVIKLILLSVFSHCRSPEKTYFRLERISKSWRRVLLTLPKLWPTPSHLGNREISQSLLKSYHYSDIMEDLYRIQLRSLLHLHDARDVPFNLTKKSLERISKTMDMTALNKDGFRTVAALYLRYHSMFIRLETKLSTLPLLRYKEEPWPVWH